jgi:hypothetical protein
MGTASLHFDPWTLAWRWLERKLACGCAHPECAQAHGVRRPWRGKPAKVLIRGSWYCVEGCAERALHDALRPSRPTTERTPNRRIPLGLVLLSRQQLTIDQLRHALESQRMAGRGRIGEWLQTLGFVSEQQVTNALARQWSCPVLRAGSAFLTPARTPQIPTQLLESFAMMPVDYIESTATLHMAFSEGIDYRVLFALEHMLGCHTEPCLALPSLLRRRLEAMGGHRGEREIVFDRAADLSEFIQIVRSYSVKIAATEIRLAAPGSYLWARLLHHSRPALDLLLRCPR